MARIHIMVYGTHDNLTTNQPIQDAAKAAAASLHAAGFEDVRYSAGVIQPYIPEVQVDKPAPAGDAPLTVGPEVEQTREGS